MISRRLSSTLVLALGAATTTAFTVRPALLASSKHKLALPPLGPTASNGLAYEDLTVGEGKDVSAGDLISVHYVGSYDQGAETVVFENSRTAKVNRGVIGAQEGDPIIFPIGKDRVIPGWEQGILGIKNEIAPMKVGGKRRLNIPATLAYGEEGRGEIPAHQDLTFDLELVEISVPETSIKQLWLYSIPTVFGFLVLNSIYLYASGQA